MLYIECCLLLVGIALACLCPTLWSRWFETVERKFSAIARRRVLSVVLVGLTALILRVALLPILPVPEPIVHDEFGYLLAADTFAHGRITNPTHPMWVHFETFNILQKPTYQCYPQPAQGLILATGKVMLGHPFWGVWLSIGVMCSAICWMLQGWMPARWALLGGLLVILRIATFGYWGNSYWGGAAGAIGGALVLGALPRLKRGQRVRDAVVMGLGLTILAISRPYEGFVLSLGVALALFVWMFGKRRPALGTSIRRVVMPLCVVLGLSAFGVSYYCWRVTGNPFRLPYQVERETYSVAPYMLWQSVRPQPVFRHEVFQRLYAVNEVHAYHLQRSMPGLILMPLFKALWVLSFYLGPALTLPLVIALLAARRDPARARPDKRLRILFLLCGLSVAGLGLELFYAPHYASPLTGALLACALLALRRIPRWHWHGKPSGLFLTRAMPVICIAMFVLRCAAGTLHIPLTSSFIPAWYQSGPKTFGRAEMLQRLERMAGQQLVIVRYAPGRDPFEEWVYNDADIDHSKVVWARDMDARENEELIKYFKDRHLWLLEADERPPRLSQYLDPSVSGTTR
jgi:hypothetical protein